LGSIRTRTGREADKARQREKKINTMELKRLEEENHGEKFPSVQKRKASEAEGGPYRMARNLEVSGSGT